MFQLDQQQAKVTSFNPRAEKHGEENVPAGDVRFQVACPNTVLDAFGKETDLLPSGARGHQSGHLERLRMV